MFKKTVLIIFFLCNVAAAQRPGIEKPTPRQPDITMLIVPRETQVVKLALDLSRYDPVLLVCYQSTQDAPVLHAWNGDGWVPISTEEYVNGTFFTTPPQQAVLIESKKDAAPDRLIPDGTWCPKGYRLSTTDPRAMIHLLGLYFNFPYSTWRQFANRYEYAVEAINPSLENIFWWHYRGDEKIPAIQARDVDADTEFWNPLDITPPEPTRPIDPAPPEEINPEDKPARKTVTLPSNPKIQPIEEPKEQATPRSAPPVPVEQIIEELKKPTELQQSQPDPFSTHDMPAADLIFLPAE